MKRKILQMAVLTALAASAALAVPTAASASTIYPPSNACSTSPSTMTAGGTIDFSCDAQTFSANETVTITVTGENGAGATFGFVKFAVSTGSTTRTSTATGSLPAVSITLPSNATGVYNIEAISATSAGGTASTTTTSANGDGLATTGSDSAAVLGLWVGGGTLVLAGAAIAVAAAVRRSRNNA